MKIDQKDDGFFFISEHKALEIIGGFTSLADIDEDENSPHILADMTPELVQEQKAA